MRSPIAGLLLLLGATWMTPGDAAPQDTSAPAAGDAVAREDGGAPKLAAIAVYNGLWKKASAARQNLVIQREAARSGTGNVGGMRVDVIKGSMSDGPGESADDVVRKQYPLPQRMDKQGMFVALASDAYTQ